MKVWVRLYNDAPYVTLNKQSTINPAQLKITRSDDQEVKSEHELKTVLYTKYHEIPFLQFL